MVDLKTRAHTPEIMDDFSQSGAVVSQTLQELERINRLLGGNNVSSAGLKRLLPAKSTNTIHIADLGCGGGDTMIYLSKWGEKNEYHLSFTGIDANPSIIEYAKSHSQEYSNIDYQKVDIMSEKFSKMQFDIVHCSLFTHHFTDDELITLFKKLLQQCTIGIIINDLHRHMISYYFTKWIIRALSKSSMVRYDSVVSITRSFKRKELESILKSAGITNYQLKWKWAYRWQLVIMKG
ncbi:MAG: methyltransferase domain-containing protein [Cyclobacteriaceae bacterium]